MVDRGMAPDRQLVLPCAHQRGDAPVGPSGGSTPGGDAGRMERVVESPTLSTALARVKANGGSPGVDGMPVEALPGYFQHHGPAIRTRFLAGSYRPSTVRRVDIPKPGGGVRQVGIPTVLDRFLQQALLQVLQPAGATTFSAHRDGCRPQRSAHQATARAQQDLKPGYDWVVDRDREKFCDRVHQDQLLSLVKGRIAARRVSHRIDRSLTAGVLPGDGCEAPGEGTPPGGPLSPLVAHRLLDRFDQALERRGHRFVRDADDSHIDVQSLRAGQRVWVSGTRCWERQWQRTVNAAKRAVDRPGRRTLLGCTCTRRRPHQRLVSEQALQALKQEVRPRTCRTRGVSLPRVVQDLQRSLDGWYAYCRFAEGQSILTEGDAWGRRRLRCDVWKPWGRRRDRELRQRGVRQARAWNTHKSAHGPWRFSRSPALAIAFSGHSCDRRGVPRLYRRPRRCGTPPNRRLRDPSVRGWGRGKAVRSPPIPILITI